MKNKKIEEIIRVDHAGEFGAQQIYAGQIKYTKEPKLKKVLMKLAKEEETHLEYFEKTMLSKRVRPTIFHPLWKLGGFSFGAITALMGKDYVMASTEAVESVIVEHYKEQLKEVEGTKEKELESKIKKFLQDESKHKDTGKLNIANNTYKLKIFKTIVKKFTKGAIKISEKF